MHPFQTRCQAQCKYKMGHNIIHTLKHLFATHVCLYVRKRKVSAICSQQKKLANNQHVVDTEEVIHNGYSAFSSAQKISTNSDDPQSSIITVSDTVQHDSKLKLLPSDINLGIRF